MHQEILYTVSLYRIHYSDIVGTALMARFDIYIYMEGAATVRNSIDPMRSAPDRQSTVVRTQKYRRHTDRRTKGSWGKSRWVVKKKKGPGSAI